MKFAKETALGGYKTVERFTSSECSHVILTKEEYQKLIGDIAQAKDEKRTAVYNAEAKVRAAKIECDLQIETLQKNYGKQLEAVQTELQNEKEHCAEYKTQNEQLRLVNRKRANQERDLRPKGQHSGYAVLQCSPKEYAWFTGKGNSRQKHTVTLWETTLQTPYSMDYTLSDVESLTKEICPEKGSWLIGGIGIKSKWIDPYEDILKEPGGEQWLSKNCWIGERFRLNAREGFWEIIITHTQCITGIPENMRLPAKYKTKSKDK